MAIQLRHRLTGDLFIGDVGQSVREEVNYRLAGSAGGQNYGWRLMEGLIPSTNSCNGGTFCATAVTYSNLATTLPILDYDHTLGRVAITGGYCYRGAGIPPLVGAYLYADEGAGQIYGATQSLAAVWSSALLTDTVFTVTTFGEDEHGELYCAHYAPNTAGAVYKILRKDADGDGMPDDDEMLAGTNPTNPASLLRVTSTVASNADWSVTFDTINGKLHRLERNTVVSTGGWLTVSNNIAGTGNSIQITDPGAAEQTQRFYRVRLLP